jgi:hypothetical protein
MEIWKDIDMEKDRDMETWINGDMGMEWRHGHGDMEIHMDTRRLVLLLYKEDFLLKSTKVNKNRIELILLL